MSIEKTSTPATRKKYYLVFRETTDVRKPSSMTITNVVKIGQKIAFESYDLTEVIKVFSNLSIFCKSYFSDSITLLLDL